MKPMKVVDCKYYSDNKPTILLYFEAEFHYDPIYERMEDGTINTLFDYNHPVIQKFYEYICK